MPARPVKIAASALVATAAAIGMSLAIATPANASSADCTSYLAYEQLSSAARSVVCADTALLSNVAGAEYAISVCEVQMALTGLPSINAAEACRRAAEPS